MDCFPDAGDRCVDVCLKHFSIQRKPQARTVRRFTDQSPVVNCHHNDAKNPQPGAISAAQAQRKVDRWSWYLMGAHGDHLRTPPPPPPAGGWTPHTITAWVPKSMWQMCRCLVCLSRREVSWNWAEILGLALYKMAPSGAGGTDGPPPPRIKRTNRMPLDPRLVISSLSVSLFLPSSLYKTVKDVARDLFV